MPYPDAPALIPDAVKPHLPLLQGKTAIVTGAGSGIGRGIALLFAQEGANIIVADQHGEASEQIVAAIEAADGRACHYPGDVLDPLYHLGLASFARHRYGWLDIAVNIMAADFNPKALAASPAATMVESESARLPPIAFAMRAQIPAMIEAGGGVIVNLAGFADVSADTGDLLSHGLIEITREIATEYSGQGIRVNAIIPGGIEARPSRHDPAATSARPSREAALDREVISEVSQVALLLASRRSRFINGVCVPVSRGTVSP